MKHKSYLVLCVFQSLLLLWAFGTYATVSTPSIFGDHMVLQQQQSLPIWGKADPGETVTVRLNNTSDSATASSEGRWRVDLPKISAGGPYELVVSGKDNSLTYTDVLVGEVWVGSGQSNMFFSVQRSANAEEEIAEAQYPNLRLFSVACEVASSPRDNCEGAWVVCSPETVAEFSAVLYFFGREVHRELDHVPMGLIHASWGGTPAEAWTSRPMLESDPDLAVIVQQWDKLVASYPESQIAYDKAMASWKKARKAANASGTPEPPRPQAPKGPNSPKRACVLYNAMINPLIPYAIRGAVWYQGEGNANRAYQYRKLFPAMITDWRNRWEQGPFPFYFVQLANFRAVVPEPAESEWAELREAQTMTLSLENTGMAVTIDIGEADDIHPKNKQDVGKRLALHALAKEYGKDVTWSGPMYRAMRIWKDKIALKFDHVRSGLTTRDGMAPTGFAIAGKDQKFVWADAVIKGRSVVVSSPQVPHPVAVRYAWADNPVCNLVNGKGLPAVPFRTDQWPGITVNNK